MEEAIAANNVKDLRDFFKNQPRWVDRSIQGLHPIAFALNTHQENTDPQLIKVLIENSTIPSLLRTDADGDSLMSFLVIIPDDKDLYSILQKLQQCGYYFNRVYGNNHERTDLDMYLSTCLQDHRPVDRAILRLLANRKVLSHNRNYLLYIAVHMPNDDMKMVIKEFLRNQVAIESPDDLIALVITKSKDGHDVMDKIKYLASVGVRPHPDILKKACKFNRITMPILNFLVNLGIHTDKENLSRCLFHMISDVPLPNTQLVKKLCDMGASPSFQRKDKRDALSLAITNRNTELTSILLNYTPAQRIATAMKERTDLKTKNTIRDYNRVLNYIASTATKRTIPRKTPTKNTIHRQIITMNEDMFKQLKSYLHKSK